MKRIIARIHSLLKKIYLYILVLFCKTKKTSLLTEQKAKEIMENYYLPLNRYGLSERNFNDLTYDLSIIIPVYNGEKYLKECIESALNQQTKYKFEVLCINDGSTDGSEDILNEYTGQSNFAYVNRKNGGISVARNAGIAMARGKYILFMDNDDYISVNFAETMLDCAYGNDADIVKCGYQAVSNITLKRKYIEGASRQLSGKKLNEIYNYNGFCWGMLINRDMFSNISFPQGYWYEDMCTRMILYPKCKIFNYVADALYFYRFHSNNSSSKVWNKANPKSLDQYYLLKDCFDILESLNVEFNESLCLAMQYELSNMLYLRTLDLDNSIREAVFILSCKINDKLHEKCSAYYDTANFVQRKIDLAFENRDFEMWERICSLI